jgi:hypothetical protein
MRPMVDEQPTFQCEDIPLHGQEYDWLIEPPLRYGLKRTFPGT